MEHSWLESLYFTLLAGFGGIVSYISSAKKFSWKTVLIRFISSGFAGYIISLLCVHFEMSQALTGCISGIFGYLGVEVTIAVLKKFVTEKIENLE